MSLVKFRGKALNVTLQLSCGSVALVDTKFNVIVHTIIVSFVSQIYKNVSPVVNARQEYYGFVILFKRSHNEICVLTDGHHNVEIKHEKLRSRIKRRSKRYSANIHILLFIYIRADIGAIKHIKWPLQI